MSPKKFITRLQTCDDHEHGSDQILLLVLGYDRPGHDPFKPLGRDGRATFSLNNAKDEKGKTAPPNLNWSTKKETSAPLRLRGST
ncbi:MAG: hypothetical protein AAGC74_06890 [Verrucomicrobiota bacterium]